jgi:transposase-like protein
LKVKRRSDVVGIFPDRPSIIRLAGSLLVEMDDEWRIGRRYFSEESLKALLKPAPLAPLPALSVPVLPIH